MSTQLPADPAPSVAEPTYVASLYPGPDGPPVDPQLGQSILQLELLLGRPVWVLIQTSDRRPFDELDRGVRDAFFHEREHLAKCSSGAALLIDSPGGDGASAYRIAKLFRRHGGHFTVVVPRRAKSAATLLTLGADEIFMGADAELGPLDVQIWDDDREKYSSALDEVQALERLNVVALDYVDQAMFLLVGRTGKKVDAILPHVLGFATDLMNPLLEKIDTVHYTQQSRALKVGEDYASRLLQANYSEQEATHIARKLVNSYPEHGFVIDADEAAALLPATLNTAPSGGVQNAISEIENFLTRNRVTVLGRITERSEVNEPENGTSGLGGELPPAPTEDGSGAT